MIHSQDSDATSSLLRKNTTENQVCIITMLTNTSANTLEAVTYIP